MSLLAVPCLLVIHKQLPKSTASLPSLFATSLIFSISVGRFPPLCFNQQVRSWVTGASVTLTKIKAVAPTAALSVIATEAL
jgi:hypothetical protein